MRKKDSFRHNSEASIDSGFWWATLGFGILAHIVEVFEGYLDKDAVVGSQMRSDCMDCSLCAHDDLSLSSAA